MYAGENNDRLCQSNLDGGWLWDIPIGMADAMTNTGAKPQIFYCPGFTAGIKEEDLFSTAAGGNGWWNFNTKRRVVGYGFLIRRLASDAFPTNPGKQDDTMPTAIANTGGGGFFVEKLNHSLNDGTNNLSNTPLIVDVSACDQTTTNFLTGIASANVPGGYYRPAHMEKTVPAGGNILFLDLHVSWRKFQQMKKMYNDPSGRAQFWY
jgi:prepilin-type processing-associated H-X9-DG protein